MTHNESISISDYFTVTEGDKVLYRPTCHYAYHPANDAVLSLHEMFGRAGKPQPTYLDPSVLLETSSVGTDFGPSGPAPSGGRGVNGKRSPSTPFGLTMTLPPKRFAALFMGNGICPPHWWAKGSGDQMELGKAALEILELAGEGLAKAENHAGLASKQLMFLQTHAKAGREVRCDAPGFVGGCDFAADQVRGGHAELGDVAQADPQIRGKAATGIDRRSRVDHRCWQQMAGGRGQYDGRGERQRR